MKSGKTFYTDINLSYSSDVHDSSGWFAYDNFGNLIRFKCNKEYEVWKNQRDIERKVRNFLEGEMLESIIKLMAKAQGYGIKTRLLKTKDENCEDEYKLTIYRGMDYKGDEMVFNLDKFNLCGKRDILKCHELSCKIHSIGKYLDGLINEMELAEIAKVEKLKRASNKYNALLANLSHDERKLLGIGIPEGFDCDDDFP